MSKTEKAVISALVISTAIGFFFLAGRVVLARKDAIGIITGIDASAKLTDKTPLEKGIYSIIRERRQAEFKQNRP